MTYELKKPIVLIGMMGAGKSAVGKALAQALDVAFLDSDDEIVQAANMSIPEIFDRYGETFFRDRETQVIERLLASGPCVLSTGGGAFLAERNRDAISQVGVSVWLRAELDLLWERVRHKTTRPLLRTADPYGTLKSLYEARVDTYGRADLVVDAHETYSISDMTQQVLRVLATRPDVLVKTTKDD